MTNTAEVLRGTEKRLEIGPICLADVAAGEVVSAYQMVERRDRILQRLIRPDGKMINQPNIVGEVFVDMEEGIIGAIGAVPSRVCREIGATTSEILIHREPKILQEIMELPEDKRRVFFWGELAKMEQFGIWDHGWGGSDMVLQPAAVAIMKGAMINNEKYYQKPVSEKVATVMLGTKGTSGTVIAPRERDQTLPTYSMDGAVAQSYEAILAIGGEVEWKKVGDLIASKNVAALASLRENDPGTYIKQMMELAELSGGRWFTNRIYDLVGHSMGAWEVVRHALANLQGELSRTPNSQWKITPKPARMDQYVRGLLDLLEKREVGVFKRRELIVHELKKRAINGDLEKVEGIMRGNPVASYQVNGRDNVETFLLPPEQPKETKRGRVLDLLEDRMKGVMPLALVQAIAPVIEPNGESGLKKLQHYLTDLNRLAANLNKEYNNDLRSKWQALLRLNKNIQFTRSEQHVLLQEGPYSLPIKILLVAGMVGLEKFAGKAGTVLGLTKIALQHYLKTGKADQANQDAWPYGGEIVQAVHLATVDRHPDMIMVDDKALRETPDPTTEKNTPFYKGTWLHFGTRLLPALEFFVGGKDPILNPRQMRGSLTRLVGGIFDTGEGYWHEYSEAGHYLVARAVGDMGLSQRMHAEAVRELRFLLEIKVFREWEKSTKLASLR